MQLTLMLMSVYFWRAVYTSQDEIATLSFAQTLDYILVAQALTPIIANKSILRFGGLLRDGSIITEMIRPVNFQGRFYAEALGELFTSLLAKLPLLLLAILLFGLNLPANPKVWGVFIISLFLGHLILFLFNWCFNCIAFYTTETWGLNSLHEAISLFFGGALFPLVMMPGWLERVANSTPFALALYTPLSILTGIQPTSDALKIWLTQIVWIVALLFISKLIYEIASRKVTVQGG